MDPSAGYKDPLPVVSASPVILACDVNEMTGDLLWLNSGSIPNTSGLNSGSIHIARGLPDKPQPCTK